jgi:enoyl-CoA hydratase/carnithine racemase
MGINMPYQTLNITVEDRFATVTLNRPKPCNVQSHLTRKG